MTSLEKAINLWYLFLTYKPGKKLKNPSIHAPLSSACIGMFQFFQKSIFDPNTCTLQRAPIMGFVDVHYLLHFTLNTTPPPSRVSPPNRAAAVAIASSGE